MTKKIGQTKTKRMFVEDNLVKPKTPTKMKKKDSQEKSVVSQIREEINSPLDTHNKIPQEIEEKILKEIGVTLGLNKIYYTHIKDFRKIISLAFKEGKNTGFKLGYELKEVEIRNGKE